MTSPPDPDREDRRPLVEELMAERFYAMRPPPVEFAEDVLDPDVYERRQRQLRAALSPGPSGESGDQP